MQLFPRLAALLISIMFIHQGVCLADESEDSPAVKEIKAMHWVRSGDLHLQQSHSTLALPAGFVGVSGAEAVRFDALINGEGDANTEGIALRKDGGTVFFQFTGDGYIAIDDWGTLDPSRLISAIRDNTETSNAIRREKHLNPLHVEGWLKEPTLDKATKTVFWAISIRRDDGRQLANSVALRLGRAGYEKFIWADDLATYQSGGVLDTILNAHSYDPGQRYDDHVAGDKLAGYGIAALVGAVAGAKLAKVAAAGGLLLLFKKFWFLVFAPLAIFYRKIKSAFDAKPPAA